MYGTFSRSDFSVLGGHAKRCMIVLTGEVLLTPRKVARIHDEAIGLKLLAAP